MDFDEIKSLSENGEEDLAPVPRANRGPAKYNFENVKQMLKSFYIFDLGFLTGGVATHPETGGEDIDIILRDDNLPKVWKEGITFRLYRMFADSLNVPYDEITDHVNLIWSSGPYTDNALVYKLKVEKVEDPEIVKMSSFDIISKSGDRIIGGYCSVTIVDSENQLITKEALESALFNFMEKKQFRNIMLSHSAIQVVEVILSYKEFKTHVDDYGMFILVKVRDDLETANEVWEQILKNELNGFSIHAEIAKDGMHKENDILIIDKLNLFEISITNSPVNKYARFDVISKSKSNKNVNNVESGGAKMVEDEKVELLSIEEEVNEIESIDSGEKVEDLELSTAEKSAVEEAVETIETTEIEVAEPANLEISKDIEARVAKLEKQMTGVLKILKKYPMPGSYPYPEKKSEENKENAEEKIELAALKNDLKDLKSNEKFNNDIAVVKKAISERDTVVADITKEFGDLKKAILEFDVRIKKMEDIPQRKTQVDFKDEAGVDESDPLIQVENGDIYLL